MEPRESNVAGGESPRGAVVAVVELVVRARAVVADLRFAVSAAVAQRAST